MVFNSGSEVASGVRSCSILAAVFAGVGNGGSARRFLLTVAGIGLGTGVGVFFTTGWAGSMSIFSFSLSPSLFSSFSFVARSSLAGAGCGCCPMFATEKRITDLRRNEWKVGDRVYLYHTLRVACMK